MTILSHKSCLIKVTTKGEGGGKNAQNFTTWFMDDPQTDSNEQKDGSFHVFGTTVNG